MKAVVLLGPPGAGKGTQARYLSHLMGGVPFLGMGDLLRDEVSRGTSVGVKIAEIIRFGEFPGVDLVMEVLRHEIEKISGKHPSLILDGVPRNIEQVPYIEEVLDSFGISIARVFLIDVPDPLLKKRLGSRFVCVACGALLMAGGESAVEWEENALAHEKKAGKSLEENPSSPSLGICLESFCQNCGGNRFDRRLDDCEDVIDKRLELYRSSVGPLVEHYRCQEVLTVINGAQPVSKVTSLLMDSLGF